MSSWGMIPPPNTTMSAASRSASNSTTRGNSVMWAPERTERPMPADVLLDGRLDDLLRGLVEPRVDDLAPGVAQGAGDHLGAAIVAIEAGFCDEDPTGHAGTRGYPTRRPDPPGAGSDPFQRRPGQQQPLAAPLVEVDDRLGPLARTGQLHDGAVAPLAMPDPVARDDGRPLQARGRRRWCDSRSGRRLRLSATSISDSGISRRKRLGEL